MTLTNRLTTNPLGLIQNFDRLFDQALRGFETATITQVAGVYDYESDEAYVLRLEIPGFTKDQIKLSLEDEEIKVSAEAGEESHAFLESYEETFSYPEDVQLDAITAKLEDGILELTLPKKEPVQPTVKTVEIK